jgi:hypothetical protein
MRRFCGCRRRAVFLACRFLGVLRFLPGFRFLDFIGPPSSGGPLLLVMLYACVCRLADDHSARIGRVRHEKLIDAYQLESN